MAQAEILIETYLLNIQSNKILGSNYYLQIFFKTIFDLEISHECLLEYLLFTFYHLYPSICSGKIWLFKEKRLNLQQKSPFLSLLKHVQIIKQTYEV